METKANISNSSAAREPIIASIRQSLAASKASDRVHAEHRPIVEYYSPSSNAARSILSHDELVGNFCANLDLLGVRFAIVRNEDEARDYLRKLIAASDIKRIAVSDSESVGDVAAPINDVEVISSASKETLFDCELGLTSAQWGIAETGTLVLESDAERHRLTSLVPPIHVCLLKAEQIRQTLGEILELTDPRQNRTITFITGASRTSDIELTLAIGVHGPRELHVLVLAD